MFENPAIRWAAPGLLGRRATGRPHFDSGLRGSGVPSTREPSNAATTLRLLRAQPIRNILPGTTCFCQPQRNPPVDLGRQPTDTAKCYRAPSWELIGLFQSPDRCTTQAGSFLHLDRAKNSLVTHYRLSAGVVR